MSTPAALDVTQPEGLEAVLDITRSAAREAAALVHAGFRRRGSFAVEHKGVVDLVTKYDRESELLLRRRLREAFPFAIVGEEQGGSAPDGGIAFYVDPIDGTTNFVHGHPFWCISIGLVISGLPVLGVVISPPLGLEIFGWVAASGEKRAVRRSADNSILISASASTTTTAHEREEPALVSPTAAFEDALLATGFPYDRRTSDDNNFEAFCSIKRRCQAVRRCGSAALDLCLVADGTYDGYWEKKLRPWDVAGGIAIVRAAGGRVTDFENGLDYMRTGHVVATNGVIHGVLLAELASVIPASLRGRA